MEASARVPLRVGFKLPRAELRRAVEDLESLPKGSPVATDFDRRYLLGEVTFEIDAPFAADPVLDHLQRAGHVDTKGPVHVSLAQPVAYVLGQLAGAMVLARHGEGDFTIPLAGGKGALTVAYEGGALHLGVPLEAYAGVAEIPAPAAARAVAAACASLASMLQKEPLLAPLTMTRFINRERGILERGGAAGEAAGPSRRWRPAEHAAGQGESLSWAATDAETGGAHVVPYWSAARTPGENALTFEPLRDPGRGERAGALAFCIFPAGERLLEAELPDDPEGETKLRARLRRRAPFSASFASGRLVKIVEAASELPMA